MPFRVGTDILEIERFSKVINRRPGIREKIFTQNELEYCDLRSRPSQHLAARFCAKEAFAKALGTGIKDFNMRDIEVLNGSSGKPKLIMSKRIIELFGPGHILDVDLSISHSDLFAIAVVIIEFERQPNE